MMVAGLIKEHNLFASAYAYIQKVFKSKRVIVALMSAFTGILPISGRVTVSAGILDTLAPPKGSKGREKFGIIDYLSTHHYYVWSPLEKTILVPMAALGMTYGAVLYQLLPLLVVSLGLVFAYITFMVKEDDIELNIQREHFKISNIIRNVFPFIGAIGVAISGINPIVVFGILTLYYMTLTLTWDINKLMSYVDWKLIAWVAVIIVMANVTRENTDAVKAYLESGPFDIDTTSGFLAISAVSLGAAFLFGSSGRFAAITTILTLVYGIEYFVWFFALDFIGYLISPMHKCMAIGKLYFNTPWRRYISALGIWALLLLIAGGSTVAFAGDFDTSQHNFKFQSGVYGGEIRQEANSPKDHTQISYFGVDNLKLDYRYVNNPLDVEQRVRGTYTLFDNGVLFFKPRVEYRHFEASNNYLRLRSIIGARKVLADDLILWVDTQTSWNFGKGQTNNSAIDSNQARIGVDYQINHKLQLGTFVQYDTDKDWNKKDVFLGTNISYKL